MTVEELATDVKSATVPWPRRRGAAAIGLLCAAVPAGVGAGISARQGTVTPPDVGDTARCNCEH